MFWLKLLGIVLGGLIALAGIVYAAGLMIPREHVVARRLTLKTAAPEEVWARISDMAGAPQWRRDVKSAVRLADRNGHEVWREDYASGDTMTFETLEADAPKLLARAIVDQEMFGGTWRIEVMPEGKGSRVTITENGWVASPIFRVLARFVFGFSGTIETYLKALAASFGEASVVEE